MLWICFLVQDIHFGEKLSREWSDGAEEPIKEEGPVATRALAGQLMRKHDSEAGRRAVRSRMQRVCKCHGKQSEWMKKEKKALNKRN